MPLAHIRILDTEEGVGLHVAWLEAGEEPSDNTVNGSMATARVAHAP